jgi:hypothetical protein
MSKAHSAFNIRARSLSGGFADRLSVAGWVGATVRFEHS